MTDNTMAARLPRWLRPRQRRRPSLTDSANSTTFAIILSLSFCHLLNDMMQSLVPALYPILKDNYALSFGQVGLITLAFQFTASMLQPVVGMYTDKKPQPYSLMVGMGFTLVGLLMMSQAHSYPVILFCGGADRHGLLGVPSRGLARGAHGGGRPLRPGAVAVPGRRQSRLGLGPAAGGVHRRAARPAKPAVFLRRGADRHGRAVPGRQLVPRAPPATAKPAARKGAAGASASGHGLSKGRVVFAVTILIVLLFSKNVYQASLGSYYTFYLMTIRPVGAGRAVLPVRLPDRHRVGTLMGGWVGDRVGRVPVMWFSILGALPFALMLPHANLFWTAVLAVRGVIMASAFPAILVYAQELLPGRVGLVAGMFFGFSFGLGGLGAAALGKLADLTSIATVYQVTPFLLCLGLLTAFLPKHPGRPKHLL